jgi:hypothetical protein
MVKQELRDIFPYKYIKADGAEADDIIGVICKHYSGREIASGSVINPTKPEKILIISGDKDFKQLHKYPEVYQYAPVDKKFISCDDPELFLHEHIMIGDRGDGVPNFLSDDDTFVADKRQKSIQKKKLATWLEHSPEDFCNDKMLRGYDRNRTMIDLNKTPDKIVDQIKKEFEKEHNGTKRKILNYMVEKGLDRLMDSIQDF